MRGPPAQRGRVGRDRLTVTRHRSAKLRDMQAMRIARRLLGVSLAAALALAAQAALDYDRLRDFLKSSLDQGFKDKQIANYLKTQKLEFALSEKLIEEFVGWGIGPRTLQALETLQPSTAGLPAPRIVPETGLRTQQPPPPSLEEQRRIIAEARANARVYTDGLPDYMCLQLTRRYVDPSGLEMDWLKYDEIKTRVSYVEGRERYELLSVNDRAVSKSFHQLGGATSSGEFGSTLAGLFSLQTDAKFTWARHSLLRGHPVYVFNVEVSRSRSSWSLNSHGAAEGLPERTIRTAYEGLVYIDKQSERVLRIVMEARGIPRDFPMQEARSRLDYDFIDISGRDFLLPLKAQVFMRDGKMLSRNEVEFRLYRKFAVEATISFDEIEDIQPLPAEEPEALR